MSFFHDACKNGTFSIERYFLRVPLVADAVYVYTLKIPMEPEAKLVLENKLKLQFDKRVVEQDRGIQNSLPKEISTQKNSLIRFDIQIKGEI